MTANSDSAAALERVMATERALGVQLDYMREMAQLGSPVLDKLQAFTALNRAEAGSTLPAEIRCFATLGAVQADDCGECLQIHINMDHALGINPKLLQAALDYRPELLPGPLAQAWRFGQAVANNAAGMEELRLALEELYGRPAMIELSYAIATARFYPTVKRALGYAQSCSLVKVKAA